MPRTILRSDDHARLRAAVRAAIDEGCISQSKLAHRLDLDPTQVAAALTGRRYPTVLLRVADWLGIERRAA